MHVRSTLSGRVSRCFRKPGIGIRENWFSMGSPDQDQHRRLFFFDIRDDQAAQKQWLHRRHGGFTDGGTMDHAASRRTVSLGNGKNCRWTIFCFSIPTLEGVKPESGTVIETVGCLLLGIYHALMPRSLPCVEKRMGEIMTTSLLASSFPRLLFPTLPATAYGRGRYRGDPDFVRRFSARNCLHAKSRDCVTERNTNPVMPIPAATLVSRTSTDLMRRRPLNPDCRTSNIQWSANYFLPTSQPLPS